MSQKPKRCGGCGHLFDPKAGNQRYCGPACYRLAKQREKDEKIRKIVDRESLENIEAQARDHGLTYGGYMAKKRMEDL
ncbi:MAG: hypothetical protein RR335_08780 [Eubacterium sp.]